MGEHKINRGSKTLLDLDYADDLIIFDENASRTSELSEVVRVQGTKTRLQIYVKKTNSLGIGMSEGEEVHVWQSHSKWGGKWPQAPWLEGEGHATVGVAHFLIFFTLVRFYAYI